MKKELIKELKKELRKEPKNEAKKDTKQIIEEYVAYWKPRLRLTDWQIIIKVMDDPKDFDGFALVEHSLNFGVVKISILEPSKIPDEWEGKRDIEVSVVHELLHTRLIYLVRQPKHNQHHEELAIETLAVLLVALKRGIDPEDIK